MITDTSESMVKTTTADYNISRYLPNNFNYYTINVILIII